MLLHSRKRFAGERFYVEDCKRGVPDGRLQERDSMRRAAGGVIFRRKVAGKGLREKSRRRVVPAGGLQHVGLREEGCRREVLRTVAGHRFQQEDCGRSAPREGLQEQGLHGESCESKDSWSRVAGEGFQRSFAGEGVLLL